MTRIVCLSRCPLAAINNPFLATCFFSISDHHPVADLNPHNPPRRIMNKVLKRVAMLLALLLVPLGLLATPGPASATTGDDDCPTGECTWEWTRTVPQSHTEYKYAKYVRTKTRTWVEGTDAEPDQWWNWSPNHT